MVRTVYILLKKKIDRMKNVTDPSLFSRAGNSLIRSSLIRSFAHPLIAHSLICSFRSNQVSDCEPFAQIAQDK